MKNRRQFLTSLAAPAAAAGFPLIVPGAALGLNGAVAASDRVTLATIGVGWMGGGHLGEFMKVPQAQHVAVCDLDEEHLSAAKFKLDTKYGNQGCATYHAFEEVLSRRDIDAVTIAVPDHWHGLVACAAARARKDIYCEKPLAHNLAEGLIMRNTAQHFGCVWQTGSWQRSKPNFRQACELVRNGRIGKILKVEVGLPSGHSDFSKLKDGMAISEPPAILNYDRWIGPAAEQPYRASCVHKNWRWNLNTGGGQLMDWVGHHLDIAHWGLGFDETGPVEVEGKGEYPPHDAPWNSATRYRVNTKYAGGLEMTIAGGYEDIRGGTKWIGETGWIWVDRNGLEASDPKILDSEIKPGEIHLPVSPGHYHEFIECVKSRKPTLTPASVAVRSATPGWLGQIAMLTESKIQWDPVAEKIVGNPAAEKLLSRDMRSPWRLR
jgi:predicted dehydrogenase